MANPEIALTLPTVPGSIPVARHVLDRLRGTIEPSRLDDLRLLVSELVTNSIRHANDSASFDLRIVGTASGIRVEVEDRGTGFDPGADHPSDGRSGWGLFLVEVLADRWGVTGGGKTTVWFELDRRRHQAAVR